MIIVNICRGGWFSCYVVWLLVSSLYALVVPEFDYWSRWNYECADLLPWSKCGTQDIIKKCLEININTWDAWTIIVLVELSFVCSKRCWTWVANMCRRSPLNCYWPISIFITCIRTTCYKTISMISQNNVPAIVFWW